MKRIAIALAAVTAVVAAGTVHAKVISANPENAVRKTLANYRDAVVNKDGAAAVALIDKASVGYYARIKRLALRATKAELSKKTLVDRMTVLRLRSEVPVKQLRAMSGGDIFEHIVDNGWNERLSKMDADIEKITVDGDTATATIKAGRMGNVAWKLTREKNAWRVDVRSMLPAAEKMIAAFHKRSGKAEDEFLLTALTFLTGKDAPATLWDPPAAPKKAKQAPKAK